MNSQTCSCLPNHLLDATTNMCYEPPCTSPICPHHVVIPYPPTCVTNNSLPVSNNISYSNVNYSVPQNSSSLGLIVPSNNPLYYFIGFAIFVILLLVVRYFMTRNQ